jgi:HK97 family phage major capsid protein
MDPKKLREKRAQIWTQMQEIQARATADGGLSAEDRAAWDAAEADLRAASEDLERAERAAQLGTVDYSQITDARSEIVNDEGDTAADYRTAFEMWARFGTGDLTPEQRSILRSGAATDPEEVRQMRALGVGTGSAGGYTVPPEWRDKLIETLKYFSGMRQNAEIITTDTGASLPWMTNNDTGNVGVILAENTAMAELDLTFGTASLDVYMYSSKMTRVSLQLVQDTALDLNAFIPRKLGERIGRIQNQHFTTGTGSSQPQGITVGGTAVQAATGQSTSFLYTTLVDATQRLDPAYLQGGNLKWMTSQAGVALWQKMVDGQSRPLWQPSLVVGAPDTFLGYPIVLNNDMPAPGASAKSLAFGDFRAGYVIRDVTGVRALRLDERYAEFLQVAFLGFQRSGGIVQDTNAFTILQHSAT